MDLNLRGVVRQSALPWPVLAVSYLNAFVLSFPMNFFGQFISTEIGMTPTQFTQYYALTFLPFSFKPLYAYMAERVSVCGSGRRGYLVWCNVMISLCMLAMATLAHEVWHVFLIGFLQNFFEAAAGMVVGLILIDTACTDQSQIPKLQAEQTLWRYLGTFSALLLSLPVSGCFSYSWDNRTALIVSAFIPLLSATAAQWLPARPRDLARFSRLGSEGGSDADPESGGDSLDGSSDGGIESDEAASAIPLSQNASAAAAEGAGQAAARQSVERQALILFVPTLVLFELVAIAVGLHGNFAAIGKLSTWHGLVVFFSVALALWVALAGVGVYRWGDAVNVRALFVISVPCIYLFVVDAMPSSMDAMWSYKYHVFQSQCQLQAMSLFSTVARIGGLFAYGLFFSSTSVEVSVLANTIFSSTVSLLEMVKVRDPPPSSPFWTWTAIDTFSSFVSALYLVSKEVVATHYSFSLLNRARKQQRNAELGERLGGEVRGRVPTGKPQTLARALSPGILYSVYLTCFDVGASASGFLTAAIMSGLGITYTDFSELPDLILICALCFIATVALIPTLRCA